MPDHRPPVPPPQGLAYHQRRKPAQHLQIRGHRIDFLLSSIWSRFHCVALDVVPAVRVQLTQLLNHEGRSAPIGLHAIAYLREPRVGGKQTLVQHLARVELFRQDLQGGTGYRVPFKNLPEICGPTTVVIVIPVMIGPDSVPGGGENFAAQNIEAEADEDIEFLLPNPLDGVVRKAMDEARGDRVHVHRFHVSQARCTVDHGVRVGRRIGVAEIPTVVQAEKEAASQPGVTQRIDYFADQRPRPARFALPGTAVENEQLDRGKITLDNVIYNFGGPARQRRGIQKQAYAKGGLSGARTPIESRVQSTNLAPCLLTFSCLSPKHTFQLPPAP